MSIAGGRAEFLQEEIINSMIIAATLLTDIEVYMVFSNLLKDAVIRQEYQERSGRKVVIEDLDDWC